MTTSHPTPSPLRASSPSPDIAPTPAIGPYKDSARCLSTASTMSHGSATTDASHTRESLGSDVSSSTFSRHSSASFAGDPLSSASASAGAARRDPTARYSTMSADRSAVKRRGYTRPQTTNFAASARQRESVLSLGSIAHLQYYFARTGLLDGKGAQLARKRQQKAQTLDFSQLDASSFSAKTLGSDVDSSYASMVSSPDLVGQSFGGMVESPTQEGHPDDGWYVDDFEDPDPDMLPPTASTYNHREKPLPKPPSIVELKADLRSALDQAGTSLEEAKNAQPPADMPATPEIQTTDGEYKKPHKLSPPGWYEVQGMHILDVMTLAIRAAKVYYTAHEHPDRLDAIKPEKEVRTELLSVMDALKRMATRNFAGGMRPDEVGTMEGWIAGLYSMLRQEEELEAAERAERASWTWLRDDQWPAGRELEREHAFILSMLAADADEPPPPRWDPLDRTGEGPVGPPTPFLRYMQTGVRLVQLHNAAVRKSRRRFGAIPSYYADTQKPYRCADNLRYWVKAAELRWEVHLRVDALGVGTLAAAAAAAAGNPAPAPPTGGSEGAAASTLALYAELEDAILKWCRKVREEIAGEVQD